MKRPLIEQLFLLEKGLTHDLEMLRKSARAALCRTKEIQKFQAELRSSRAEWKAIEAELFEKIISIDFSIGIENFQKIDSLIPPTSVLQKAKTHKIEIVRKIIQSNQ